MANILFTTRNDLKGRGGSAFHARNLISVLEAAGHVVPVWEFKQGGYDEPVNWEIIGSLGDVGFVWEKLDYVIADYSWMCGIFDQVPRETIKICFVHDLRTRIVPCLKDIGYKDNQYWSVAKEGDLLRKADILLVLNEEDGKHCRRMAPDAKIIRIGIAIESKTIDRAKQIEGRCLYVGSNVMENQYAIKWFQEYVWPLVKEKVPQATFNFLLHGEKPAPFYEVAKVALVPHIMKGGLKIKAAEAFSYGLPVVGNLCGLDGFEEWPYCSDDPYRMALMISDLLTNFEAYHHATQEVRRLCQPKMTVEAAYGDLLRELA